MDRDSLKVASHKLERLYDKLDNMRSSENSNFSAVVNHRYFSYFCLFLVKILVLYIGYKLIMKCKNRVFSNIFSSRHNHERSTITNCITFNLCEKKNVRSVTPHNDVNIELNDNPDHMRVSESEIVSENSETPLRRSGRLAKLKDSI